MIPARRLYVLQQVVEGKPPNTWNAGALIGEGFLTEVQVESPTTLPLGKGYQTKTVYKLTPAGLYEYLTARRERYDKAVVRLTEGLEKDRQLALNAVHPEGE